VVDLTTAVGAVSLATPVIAASGTYGYGIEYDGLVDWSLVGGVSVKGLSLEPSQGHGTPRMVETAAGMLNAIGLQNIGIEAFVRDKLPRLRTAGTRIIVNCWGNTPEEYERVVERLDSVEGIDALEINMSSPNKREWGRPLAADPNVAAAVIRRIRSLTRLPVWAKLTPNVTDIVVVARAVADAGADAITLINTLKGMAVDVRERKPILANVTGGLSGPAVKPVALYLVYEVCRAVSVPVVGCGGIWSGSDALEFLIVGASAVQVGTANLYDPGAPARIARELASAVRDLGESTVRGVIGTLRAR
jgi:dihydroorotate dehydrogenase (NAD+) catalytic subunit